MYDRGQTWFPPKEEIELNKARDELDRARENLRAAIDRNRDEPHWLEQALSRPAAMNQRRHPEQG